ENVNVVARERARRALGSLQLRISAAVEALMMLPDRRGRRGFDAITHHFESDLRMFLPRRAILILLSRVQLVPRAQVLGKPGFSDVMKHPRHAQVRDLARVMHA